MILKRFLIAVLTMTALSLSLDSNAAKPLSFAVWPDGAPTGNGLKPEDEKINNNRPSHVATAELYVYPAKKPNGTAILMCPGGGYTHLAVDHEGHDMADWFNSMGITYAVLKYRMPNLGHSDVPLSDAEQAMRIIRSHAAEWGVNPNKVGVMGASAGGHLASTLATQYTSPATRPDFQILFYPVITMEEGVTHQGSRDNLIGKKPSKELVDMFSNEKRVNAQTPKAFIMVSADDGAVPVANSLRYVEALSANKVPFSLHVYPTGGHGWGFRDTFPYKPLWKSELDMWLRKNNL